MNSVETAYMKIRREENILHCIFSENLEMDITIAKHCVNERILFSEGKSYPCLIDMRGVKSATKDAREYMAAEGVRYVKAGALLVGSALTKMLGNLFLSINKPGIPTKLFTDEGDAREWLKKFA